ncbi:hypothetical protein, partial [Psychrobacillus soli]|uniref:hypothetical protein n=1 Tax=Psychrobacillus soli TaxID=1543965 RepID=UPI001C8D6641
SNLVALGFDLIAFRIELVASNDQLVALNHLLDLYIRKNCIKFCFLRVDADKYAISVDFAAGDDSS